MGSFEPVWNSGINAPMGFAWAMVERPGIYLPVGLPRDRLLQHLLRQLAAERAMRDATSPEIAQELTRKVLAPPLEVPGEELEELRRFLLVLESQTGLVPLAPCEADMDQGGHSLPFPFRGAGLSRSSASASSGCGPRLRACRRSGCFPLPRTAAERPFPPGLCPSRPWARGLPRLGSVGGRSG